MRRRDPYLLQTCCQIIQAADRGRQRPARCVDVEHFGRGVYVTICLGEYQTMGYGKTKKKTFAELEQMAPEAGVRLTGKLLEPRFKGDPVGIPTSSIRGRIGGAPAVSPSSPTRVAAHASLWSRRCGHSPIRREGGRRPNLVETGGDS